MGMRVMWIGMMMLSSGSGFVTMDVMFVLVPPSFVTCRVREQLVTAAIFVFMTILQLFPYEIFFIWQQIRPARSMEPYTDSYSSSVDTRGRPILTNLRSIAVSIIHI
jgi:hypothetical protein